MKILTKRITVGEYSFDISTDTNIAVKAFEEFPDFSEKCFKKVNNDIKGSTPEEIMINAIKEKKLGELLNYREEIDKQTEEVVLFAFPYMYEKANGKKDTEYINNFITFIKGNNVFDEFVDAVFGFLLEGFSQKEKAQPKVKFVLK